MTSKAKFLVESLLKEIGEGSKKPCPFNLASKKKKTWEYDFETESGIYYTVYFDITDDKVVLSFAFDGGDLQSMTNKNEVYSIMSTLIEITKDYIKKNPTVDHIHFKGSKKKNAVEDISQRTKMYFIFAKKNLPTDWNISQSGNEINLIKKNKN